MDIYITLYLLKQQTYRQWSEQDDGTLIEYVSLYYTAEGGKGWPGFDKGNPLWSGAADYLAKKQGANLRQGIKKVTFQYVFLSCKV